MEKKAFTKKYGFKIIHNKKPIEGTDLFLAEVNPDGTKSRPWRRGIVDKDNREVVPFTEFDRVLGVRRIDERTTIVDCVITTGTVGGTLMGSFLIVKRYGEYLCAYC